MYYVTPSFKCVGYKSRYDSNHCVPHNILEFDKKKKIIIINVIFSYNMCIIYYTIWVLIISIVLEKKIKNIGTPHTFADECAINDDTLC